MDDDFEFNLTLIFGDEDISDHVEMIKSPIKNSTARKRRRSSRAPVISVRRSKRLSQVPDCIADKENEDDTVSREHTPRSRRKKTQLLNESIKSTPERSMFSKESSNGLYEENNAKKIRFSKESSFTHEKVTPETICSSKRYTSVKSASKRRHSSHPEEEQIKYKRETLVTKTKNGGVSPGYQLQAKRRSQIDATFIEMENYNTCLERTTRSPRRSKTQNAIKLHDAVSDQSDDEEVSLKDLKVKLKRNDGEWSSTTPVKSVDFSDTSNRSASRSKFNSSAFKSARKSLLPKLVEENKTSSITSMGNESEDDKRILRPSTRKKSPPEINLCVFDSDFDDSTESEDDSDSWSDSDWAGRLRPRNVQTPKKNYARDEFLTVRTPRTPRTPKMNVKLLTPVLPKRSSALSTPTTPKDRAMVALHISQVPESLPCRQREYDTIYSFLSKKIKCADGGFMYIYGIPGAGKTATVDRVIKRLQHDSDRKKLKKFTFVEINGMHLTRPTDAYCQILKTLEKKFVTAKVARRILEEKFKSTYSQTPLLLLIDEFDMLFNRTLSVVDSILDWVDQSKLIVVAIANSKDLIEEISKSSTKSRMFRERVCDVQFKTYSFQELQEIIEDRLKDNKVFSKDAVRLLARKSAISGDVRLALNLCRRVLSESGDARAEQTLGITEVSDLLSKIYKDPRIEFIKSLSRQEQIFLRAIRDVILLSGSPSSSLARNVYDQYKSLCYLEELDAKDEFSLFRMLRLFESYSLLSLTESPCTIHTEISLGNNLDLIQIAFPPKISE